MEVHTDSVLLQLTLLLLLLLFVCQVACAAYCIAIAHLINNPRDATGAIQAAQHWLQQRLAQQTSPDAATQPISSNSYYDAPDLFIVGPEVWETVLNWLAEATADEGGPGPAVEEQAGFLKWGFVHAFR